MAHSTTTRQEGVSEYPLAMAAFKPLKEFADVLKVISYVAEAYDDTGKNLKSLRRDKSPRRGGVSQKLLALAH
ncbi:hypothetical protein [Sulfobacillus thermosulfidooxidans]|uniref:hypothetical protein n=1 Tax=Sulfobacillus thermosulfidooxidans TaxID=28034 RepID=UPI00111201EE|nr:hypothetical protein [Sulfobacillus thermosulfidooxidans]